MQYYTKYLLPYLFLLLTQMHIVKAFERSHIILDPNCYSYKG